nr:reverse transcriptase [Tanacetum cinerariifolium]
MVCAYTDGDVLIADYFASLMFARYVGEQSPAHLLGDNQEAILKAVTEKTGSGSGEGGGSGLAFNTNGVQLDHPWYELTQTYSEVFQTPKGLPPTRPFDHRIVLKEGTLPISQRPYRYPPIQKDVIEKTTRELLESGVIRDSQSSFAAPVVLVKKKDGQWRMCMDYRRLNEATIKDKFPIPLIEELLDELGGSSFFSKLDLRLGYHQSEEAQMAFEKLKEALTSAPVLALPDPTKQFILETDASAGGLGAVLMQERHPVTTPLQHKWLAKLMGYNYVIEYKKGRENVTADALSRVQGLLQPLPIPNGIFSDVSMDFIGGLPKVKGKDTIFVVVDRLTKYAHFVLLGHPFLAEDVAQVFIDNIYKLHGCLNSIISDRDPVFLSSFWTEFLNLQGVSAKLSTRTPFEALYGYRPPLHIPYIPRDVADQDVDELMRDREAAIKVLRQSLLKAQNRMKHQADKHRTERRRMGHLLPISKEARFCLRPSAILDRKLVKRKNRATMKVLVQWKDQSEHDATWELLDELQLRFPDFSELVSCGQEIA